MRIINVIYTSFKILQLHKTHNTIIHRNLLLFSNPYIIYSDKNPELSQPKSNNTDNDLSMRKPKLSTIKSRIINNRNTYRINHNIV